MFIVWPDMWYHTSGDTPDKSDSTQLKRVVFLSAAAAIFLANAGPQEVEKMIAETSGRGLSRIGAEKIRAERMILLAEKKDFHTPLKEAQNILNQAFLREKEALSSIKFFIKGEANLENYLKIRLEGLESLRNPSLKEIEEVYKLRCWEENIKPQKLVLTKDEIRLSKLVPLRTERMRGYFDYMEFRERLKDQKGLPTYNLGRAEFEVRNFIDGKRSILEIRNAVSAEFEPLALKDVENAILVLEKAGFVEIKSR